MNTIKSVYYGWATLIVAGGGAYYFAKRSINEDRARKAEADRQKRQAQYQLEAAHFGAAHAPPRAPPSASNTNPRPPYSGSPVTSVQTPRETDSTAGKSVSGELAKRRNEMGKKERNDEDWHTAVDEGHSPAQEASHDPAPTRHEPEDEGQKMKEKSKYEASDVFRSRKGDRFS